MPKTDLANLKKRLRYLRDAATIALKRGDGAEQVRLLKKALIIKNYILEKTNV